MSFYGYNKRRYSWKTTAGGVVALLALIFSSAAAMLDDDPETMPDWNSVAVAAVAVGTLFARDSDVTSEEAGAK